MLRVFVDSDSEFTNKKAAEYGLELISMPYTIGEDTIFPFAESDDFDYKGFYNMLRSGTIPTTSALNETEYLKKFEPAFANGDDILCIHFSSAMSASFGFMNNAVEKLLKKYPGRKFAEIDTLSITIGSYIIVDELGKLYKNGATLDEMLEWAKNEVQHFACYFFADDLKFFRRSGRVSGLASFFGNLMGIRPIIVIDDKGVMRSISKVKGRMNAINYLVEKTKELGLDIKEHKVVIGHTDAKEEILDSLEQALKEEYGADLEIERILVNPTIGSHCGPDGVGVAFHSKSR